MQARAPNRQGVLFMSHILKIYRLLNILSVDVSAGAVICALFFANIFHVAVGTPGLVVLGLTVWIIYSADHLLDARRIRAQAVTDRHRFYQQYFGAMLTVTAVVAVADATMILFLRPPVFHAGVVVGAAVAVYLIAQRYFGFLKELIGALLYTGGVVLPAFVFLDGSAITPDQWIVIVCFLLIAWTNLLVFSYFDRISDEEQGQVSFTTSLGARKTRILIRTLVAISILLCLYLMVRSLRMPSVVLLTMSVVLALLMRHRVYFGAHDRYRYVGDAVFLLPLFVFLP